MTIKASTRGAGKARNATKPGGGARPKGNRSRNPRPEIFPHLTNGPAQFAFLTRLRSESEISNRHPDDACIHWHWICVYHRCTPAYQLAVYGSGPHAAAAAAAALREYAADHKVPLRHLVARRCWLVDHILSLRFRGQHVEA